MFEGLFDKKELPCQRGVKGYRVKTIKSGEILECEIYPMWKRSYIRGSKLAKSRKAQENLNAKNRRKKIVRLINTNFCKEDIWLTVTYDGEHNPLDMAQAQKNIRNYLRKIKRRDKGVKYIYVTEGKEKNKRFHHHVILSTKLTRDEIEELWTGGARKEAHRLQPDEFYLTGLGMYMTKDIEKGACWGKSKNLAQPKESVADTKITRRKAQRMAENENYGICLLEKEYRGYKNLKMEWFASDIVSGVYIRAVMRKIETIKQRR